MTTTPPKQSPTQNKKNIEEVFNFSLLFWLLKYFLSEPIPAIEAFLNLYLRNTTSFLGSVLGVLSVILLIYGILLFLITWFINKTFKNITNKQIIFKSIKFTFEYCLSAFIAAISISVIYLDLNSWRYIFGHYIAFLFISILIALSFDNFLKNGANNG